MSASTAPAGTLSRAATAERARTKRPGRNWGNFGLLVPFGVFYLLFLVGPLVYDVVLSFFNASLVKGGLGNFAGLANYRNVFTTGGGHALIVTAAYTIGFVLVCMLAGLAIALLLDVRLPGLKQVRAFFVIPLVVPAVATAFIWFTLFQPQTGLINRFLADVGLPQVSLSTPRVAFGAVIAFGAWQFFGEAVLLYLAALKSLPADVLEAASVDGAGAWARLRRIRLPLLRHQTGLIAVIATLTGLQTFTQIFILTNGGPDGATQTALYYVYQQAFGLGADGSAGWADAMAVILFLISISVTVAQLAIVGRSAYSEVS